MIEIWLPSLEYATYKGVLNPITTSSPSATTTNNNTDNTSLFLLLYYYSYSIEPHL